jgi:hypothetical protein
MNATQREWKLGDEVWVPRVTFGTIEETCPDCLGTAKWHCVLPSGEEFDIECPRCYPGGYERSTGRVNERTTYHAVSLRTSIKGIKIEGVKILYDTDCGRGMSTEQLFQSQDAAQAAADEQARVEVVAKQDSMTKEAKRKGRPKKNRDGIPENDGVGHGVNYARSCIRDGFKEAVRWYRHAQRAGTELDLHKYLEEEIGK